MDIVYLPDIEGIKSPEGDIEISIFDFVYEDIAKASIPGIWLLISLVAVFTYLLYPKPPRWKTAFAWILSFFISICLIQNIWRYHRRVSYKYKLLSQETKEKSSVYFKIFLSTLILLFSLVFGIYLWCTDDPEEYGDACAYTMTFIFSIVWLTDLLKNHLQ